MVSSCAVVGKSSSMEEWSSAWLRERRGVKKTWVVREESRMMQLCGFGERRTLKGSSLDSHRSLATAVVRGEECGRPGPTSFLSLRHWSALPAAPRHANIDYRPSHISSFSPSQSVRPFSESCRWLVFSALLFSLVLHRRRRDDDSDDDNDDSVGENSRLKLHFRNAAATASFMRKISFSFGERYLVAFT